MQLSIRHTTRYEFSQPASRGLQRLRLKPKPTHGQQVLEWEMELEGARPEVEYDDQHHNHTSLVSVEPGVTLQRATEPGSEEAFPNLPLLPGDRLWTDRSGRAELQFADGTVLRLDSDAIENRPRGILRAVLHCSLRR